ncbi:putative S-receptor kinase [Melia azedarach]|uniref:S-receptor kinase n=1 Tax=Melia azedarach TaxID=155640 RepID=A0ACC1Z4B3_MELAZ|nr:putative S-receptor kinase [Melia azedarach]
MKINHPALLLQFCRKMGKIALLPQRFLVFLYLLSFMIQFSKGSDTILSGQSLSGNQTLISSRGTFELGFFAPEDGNLVLLNSTQAVLWSTNSTNKVNNSTTAKLLDNGNLVVRNELESSSVLWQSIDHPTDHWLSGGKIGYNKVTNEMITLVSWRSSEDPAPGQFTLELGQNGVSHLILLNGSQRYWTSLEMGKVYNFVPPYVTNFSHVLNDNESYFIYYSDNPNILTRFVLDLSGQYSQYLWQKSVGNWKLVWTRPKKCCDVSAVCGPFSVYNPQDLPACVCMEGFKPKIQKKWDQRDHTDGCVRRVPLKCDGGGKDRFIVMPNMLFQDTSESLAVKTIEQCESACLSNCSCNAFAYYDRCLIWEGNISNMQFGYDEGIGRDFHLRIAASNLIPTASKTKRKTAWIALPAIAGFLTLFSAILVILQRRRSRSAGLYKAVGDSLIFFKHRDLKIATQKFSEKLGEGAFGSVFKGTLPDLTTIAVKQLRFLDRSREKQFIAEVKTIGLIQHVNLVRLRGICVEDSKRSLVYEYMPNGSLDSVLFRKSAGILDWQKRYKIAVGTARGLAYLHEECRDCIIHCDIKPENILLDADYNPKISDFGLAKLIGRDYSRVLTTMRGTMGYLAPEWISGEAVTAKADVFSYGMLLLEVISGKRNRDLSEESFDHYFPLQVATAVYNGENVLGLLDDRLQGNAMIEELTRVCRVASWCIQEDAKDRPTMGQIVKILEGLSEVGISPIPCFLRQLCRKTSPTDG